MRNVSVAFTSSVFCHRPQVCSRTPGLNVALLPTAIALATGSGGGAGAATATTGATAGAGSTAVAGSSAGAGGGAGGGAGSAAGAGGAGGAGSAGCATTARATIMRAKADATSMVVLLALCVCMAGTLAEVGDVAVAL